jgi:DNA-directed RNA polymerase specialized sigma24 family protein
VAFVDLLQQIEAELAAQRRAGTLDRTLLRWKARNDALEPFADADTLITFLRDPSPTPRGAKDPALAALCVEASRGDQVAATLLLWLMLPALLRVRRRLAASNALGAEDLDAELIVGVWEAASVVTPATSGVGARMVNRARRRALAAVRRAADWAGRSEPLSTDITDETSTPDSGALKRLVSKAVRAGVISMDEAELVCTSGDPRGELRARLGVSPNAVRMRRLRARQRLRRWIDNSR